MIYFVLVDVNAWSLRWLQADWIVPHGMRFHGDSADFSRWGKITQVRTTCDESTKMPQISLLLIGSILEWLLTLVESTFLNDAVPVDIYREFSPYANFITVNFIYEVFQNYAVLFFCMNATFLFVKIETWNFVRFHESLSYISQVL